MPLAPVHVGHVHLVDEHHTEGVAAVQQEVQVVVAQVVEELGKLLLRRLHVVHQGDELVVGAVPGAGLEGEVRVADLEHADVAAGRRLQDAVDGRQLRELLGRGRGGRGGRRGGQGHLCCVFVVVVVVVWVE